MTPDRVFVLGAGRAGLGLARALRVSGADVVGLHGRHARDEPEPVTAGAIPDAVARATVVIVTVRDAQLEDALHELAAASLAPRTAVLHASGSSDPSALGELRQRGHPAGTFHPLVPLVDPARAPDALRGAWIGIDGDAAAVAVARRLADHLGANVLVIPEGAKARYHAAAVLASNFPAVLLSLGERLLGGVGLDERTAHGALLPLLLAAGDNLRTRTGAAAMTGPIVRGDVRTVREHLAALRSDPVALDVYRALSRAAVELAATGETDRRALTEIGELLEEADAEQGARSPE